MSIALQLTRRLLILVASLFAASIVVFLVLSVLPGSPAQVILGTQATRRTWPSSPSSSAWTSRC